ncbi:MAG: hypothetical protein GY751_04150 [Bacteroidetes bacterium]|nr:hypothetical protein [Bacteroidota bacterium]
MKTLISAIAFVLLLVLSSCSTDASKSSSPKNSDLMLELAETKWNLVSGPSHDFLTINGYSETEYLDYLNFSESKVYIVHKDANFIMPHHICFINGSNLVVSIQECSNTTWRSLFEWDVVSLDGNTMTINVTAPNMSPTYMEQFVYVKI